MKERLIRAEALADVLNKLMNDADRVLFVDMLVDADAKGTVRRLTTQFKRQVGGWYEFEDLRRAGVIQAQEDNSDLIVGFDSLVVDRRICAPKKTPSQLKELEQVDSLNEMLAKRIMAQRGEGTGMPAWKSDVWRRNMSYLLNYGPTDIGAHTPIPYPAVLGMINFVFDHLDNATEPRGFCWASVIQSPTKLRKHWTKLAARKASFHEKPKPLTYAQLRERVNAGQ